jgi:3-phosphoshikimate 1-carboxyvinyltransferase
MTIGDCRIEGLLEGEDVLATAAALRALGVTVEKEADGAWRVQGVGVGGLAEPGGVLDLGNAGTGVRLLMGLLAGHPFTSFLSGDASLRRRPMGRVLRPLGQMGARCLARSGERLPLALTGRNDLLPIRYEQPVASAQVKSAVLLAGLHAAGETTVIEPAASRDHTERMLAFLGATLHQETLDDGRNAVTITGQPELLAKDQTVPGDPSSAAFPLVAAALVPGSRVRIEGVGINPLRSGLFACLEEMGADFRILPAADGTGEPLATLEIAHGPLRGIEVPPERGPSMIDEYPILAIAAASAEGTTRLTGLGELRVKESDRLRAIAQGLEAAGVDLEIGEDSLVIHGRNRPPRGGMEIRADHDHRIAMSFLVLGLVSERPVEVEGAETIQSSFPGFARLMNGLGARIRDSEQQDSETRSVS